MAANIPLRPKSGSFNLKAEEMDCLSWVVLSGCNRIDAFLRFVRPDYLGTQNSPSVREAVRQFFGMANVREYIDAYKATLHDITNPQSKTRELAGTLEERKARAKTKATEFAISLADNIEQADDPEFVLKLMDKVGLLEQEDRAEEVPRRYLPVTCNECEYRKFVEENCERVDDGTELEGTPQTQNNE